MKGFCLFSGSKATNNEEFRKQLQAKNKALLGLILLGIISAAAAYYMEFWGKMKVDDYMLGVYCGHRCSSSSRITRIPSFIQV